MGNSDINFPRVNDLLLSTEDIGGGKIFVTEPRGCFRLINRHCIGNLSGFPKLIFWRKKGYHPTIDPGWEVGKMRMPALLSKTDPPFRDSLT